MTTTRDLIRTKSQLINEFGQLVSQAGFPARPRGDSFTKPVEYGLISVHINTAFYPTYFAAAVDVAIQVKRVEEIIMACYPEIPKALKPGTFTTGCELGNLRDGRWHSWRDITPESDLKTIAREMSALFHEVGLRYFERLKTETAIYELLRRDDEEARRLSADSTGRAERAVVLAYLLKGPDEAERMINIKRARLEQMDPDNLRFFERTIKCIRQHFGLGSAPA